MRGRDPIEPALLRPLLDEIRLAGSRRTCAISGWGRNVQRGFYWHFTRDSEFRIDPRRGPRDMSSMGDSGVDAGALMVTSHFECWDDHYSVDGAIPRPYVALIDLKAYRPEEYQQVSRGARVVRVLPIAEARRLNAAIDRAMPTSERALRALWDRAHRRKVA